MPYSHELSSTSTGFKPRTSWSGELTTWPPGSSCSKLTKLLVNDSLKFTSSDTQICWNFLLKKCEYKSYSHFFQQKISEYCILNLLKQLMKWPLTRIVKPSDTQICWNFWPKNVSSFCSAKATAKATHIFSAKNIRILYIESAKTVNEMTLNENR